MEPGGSELEPSLPTQDNPCLIVEDSQPDSGALEEDPESGYRTLLAKRLSNLQPHAHSPVLELISSPLGGKGCAGDGQQEGQSDGHPSSATVDSNQTQSSAIEENSQLLVCPLTSPKSESAGEDVGDSADSTTHCAQSEVGTSQFGLLELSETQGLREEHESQEETDTSGRVTESPQKQSNQGENSLTPPGQDDASKRSEVTSSCTTELQSREVTNEKKMTFHHFLLGQGSEVFPQEEDSQLSTQEDLFERDDTGSTVDSTVAEPETPGMPASTPANSLRLLHLSGHTALVQESLSQNSVEFVAPSQDNFGPTPIIVPNSPTEQEDEPGDDEPMDTSVSPDEAEQPQKKEEEPMETDQLPTESFPAHPDPISSSPKSRNSPALVLEKTLPVPSQPQFSHDIFVPTPSLEASSSSVAESGRKEVPPKDSPLRPLETGSSKDAQAEASRQEQHKANPCQSGPSVPEESFRLELSTNSECSSLFQKTQGKEEEDDSELTQIEELDDSAGAATNDPSLTPASQTKEKDMGNATGTLQPNESSLFNVSEGPKAIKDSSIEQTATDLYPSENAKAEKFADKDNDVSDVSNAAVTGLAVDMQRASEATDSTKPSSLQSAEPAGSASPSSSSPNPQTVDLATTSSVQEDQEFGQNAGKSEGDDVTVDTSEEEQVQMEEDKKEDEGSGLCLALSQSQAFSPEPMEEEDSFPAPEEPSVPKQDSPPGVERQSVGEEEDVPSSVIVIEESERDSQKEDEEVTLQPNKAQTVSSQPVVLDSSQDSAKNSAAKSLSDSSGEIPFHFTLPKEGELIRPAATATPPPVDHLKLTPRHSTPIEVGSCSVRAAVTGDVSRETAMTTSDIMAEESGGDGVTSDSAFAVAERDAKLSLRMKLVTPVNEESPESACFSLQKPALSEEEVSVATATTVAKAVTSPLRSPSVFSRVCEVRRQVEAAGKERPSTPTSRAPQESDQSSSRPPEEEAGQGSSVRQRAQRAQRLSVREKEIQTDALASGRLEETATQTEGRPGLAEEEEERCSATVQTDNASRALLRQRAVSQQTSFDATGTPTLPRKGDPESPPPRPPPGQSVRRHVRTIREVRTVVTRIITDVYYEDGKEVDRTVTEESEEPLVDCRVVESDLSPSRTAGSMTSGDLGDVSSLSSKTPSLQRNSSGASSGGPGPARRMGAEDATRGFIMPPHRGASARLARGTEDRARELETGPLTPLTPRGRARRGRPPSRTPFSRECGTPTSRDSGQGLPSSSSEDEPYNQMCAHVSESPPEHRPLRRSNSPEFGVLPPQSPDTGGSVSSFVGLRVVAKWSSNGYFYSGCITRDSGAGRFRLLFDDGYECDVLGKDILLCDPIPLETEVTALSEDEYFSAGVVKGHKKEGSDFFYCVEKDGQRKWYRRMAVILSLEQGNRLREQFGLGPYEPVTPLTKASDISLDNLVEGKRKRRGNVGASGTPTRGPSESPRAPGNTGKRKLISAAEEDKCPAKRGRKSACPKTGRRVEACNTSESGAELPSDPAELVETHGPLPQMTASSESDRETNQPGSEGEEEYVQTAPYNKHYTESQLRTGGGYILQDFNEGQCNAAYQSLLIADQYCRTRKYLLCVASGVPCVSHLWVQYCCRDNKLLNYKDYLLPAGVGLPDNRIVEW
ncbi:TP53B protein, partial [Atractosteus spatula]|nr:TP53B protein [Atractosteus spatula]